MKVAVERPDELGIWRAIQTGEEGSETIHADSLLRANLQRVFNDRDPARRAAALDELFVDEPVMYEPEAEVRGKGCDRADRRRAAR